MSSVGAITKPISHLRTFLLHSAAFGLPITTLWFWVTGPHRSSAALLWLIPVVVMGVLDRFAPTQRSHPREDMPHWPYVIQLYALYVLQMANYALLVLTASQLRVDTPAHIQQTLAMLLATLALSATNAAYSGIVIAHELIHCRSRFAFTLGRLMLVGVLYEHYSTEHVRGHHPRVGTADDPATARYGETSRQYLFRTLPAQFKSAWALEKVRLNHHRTPLSGLGWLRHRVLQGVIMQASLLVAIGYCFGTIALGFFFMHALICVRMLENSNYVSHWGLSRVGKAAHTVESWDNDNAFTLYTLVGMSRHADHHAQAARPYQKLRYHEETAKMPFGYYNTMLLAMFWNRKYRTLASAELQRKKLGPFRVRESADTITTLPIAERRDAVA